MVGRWTPCWGSFMNSTANPRLANLAESLLQEFGSSVLLDVHARCCPTLYVPDPLLDVSIGMVIVPIVEMTVVCS